MCARGPCRETALPRSNYCEQHQPVNIAGDTNERGELPRKRRAKPGFFARRLAWLKRLFNRKEAVMDGVSIKQGQVWKDNWVAKGGTQRYVKVLEVPATVEPKANISIQRCNEDGSDIARSPKRTTQALRFKGGKGGFSLHREADGSQPQPQAQAQETAAA
jgi:hypothetical protein